MLDDRAPSLPTPRFLGLVALIGLAGLAVRVVAIREFPAGLHFDQAANGLLGLEILASHQHPVFFSSYTGREALFMYVIAGLSALLGPGLLALRLAGALCGAATVVALAFLGATLFGRRVGLAAAAFLAGLYWHLHVSRLAERTIMVPLLDTLALLAFWEGFRRRSLALAALGGGLAGLQLYTYPSSRFFIVALVAIAAIELVALARSPGTRGVRSTDGDEPHPSPLPEGEGEMPGAVHACENPPRPLPCSLSLWERVGVREGLLVLMALLAFVLVATPLAIHFARVPEDFLGRADQVAVWNAGKAGPSLLAAVASSTARTLLMFVVRGDGDWKYNLAGRPVFDPISGALFLLGLGVALVNWRRPAARLGLVWWLAMLLPGFLSLDAPQFMRTLGAAPAACLFAALGLEAIVIRLQRLKGTRFTTETQSEKRKTKNERVLCDRSVLDSRHRPPARHPFVFRFSFFAGLLWLWPLVAGAYATYQYFAVWGPSPAAFLALEGDVTDAAAVVRAEAPKYPATYVASRYGPDPTISFLAGDQFGKLRWFDGRVALPLPPPGAGPTLYVLPRTAVDDYWLGRLPAADRVADIAAPDGGPAVEAFVLRPGEIGPGEAGAVAPVDFGGMAKLVGADVPTLAQAGVGTSPAFYWQIEKQPPQEVKFFVHLVDAAGQTWAQYDELAYPAADWRPGQVLVVRRPLALPDDLPIGPYVFTAGIESASGAALPASDAAGHAAGDAWRSAPFPMARPPRPVSPAGLTIATPLNALLGGSVRLLGASVGQTGALDGDSVPVTFYWQVVRPPGSNLQDAIQLADPTGRVVARTLQPPTGGVWPSADWQAGDVVVDRQSVLVPAGTTAGALELSVGIVDAAGHPLEVAGQTGAEVPLARLAIKARPRSAPPMTISHPQAAAFAAPLALVGYDVAPASIRPGETLRLTLYWRADQPPHRSWTVFTHLLDQSEKIQAQQDGLPAHGRRPTTTWAPGEIIADPHELTVDPGARPGVDRVEIGLYDATTGQRLKLSSGDDRVLLNLPVQVQ